MGGYLPAGQQSKTREIPLLSFKPAAPERSDGIGASAHPDRRRHANGPTDGADNGGPAPPTAEPNIGGRKGRRTTEPTSRAKERTADDQQVSQTAGPNSTTGKRTRRPSAAGPEPQPVKQRTGSRTFRRRTQAEHATDRPEKPAARQADRKTARMRREERNDIERGASSQQLLLKHPSQTAGGIRNDRCSRPANGRPFAGHGAPRGTGRRAGYGLDPMSSGISGPADRRRIPARDSFRTSHAKGLILGQALS